MVGVTYIDFKMKIRWRFYFQFVCMKLFISFRFLGKKRISPQIFFVRLPAVFNESG
jgi:hypothetical protein